MKRLGRFTAVLAIGALLVTQAMAQAKVTIYSAAPQDLIDNVIPAFEKAANVKVDLIKGGSGELSAIVREALREYLADELKDTADFWEN